MFHHGFRHSQGAPLSVREMQLELSLPSKGTDPKARRV